MATRLLHHKKRYAKELICCEPEGSTAWAALRRHNDAHFCNFFWQCDHAIALPTGDRKPFQSTPKNYSFSAAAFHCSAISFRDDVMRTLSANTTE